MDSKEGYQNKEGSEGRDATPAKVREMLPDAPDYIVAELLVPDGYRLSPMGTFQTVTTKAGTREKIIARAPILIAYKYRDWYKREALVLAWRTDRWSKREVVRGGAGRTSDLLRLADFGLPVTSANARDLMNYLAAFEGANFDTLPIKPCDPIRG